MRRIYLALGVLMALFSSMAFSASREAIEAQRATSTRHNAATAQPRQVGVLYKNPHLLKYIPGNITLARRGSHCTDAGVLSPDGTGTCADYKRADGSLLRIRGSFADGNAEGVFTLANGHPEPWVQFKKGTQQVVYVSPGAQQYAMAHGGSPSIAQGKQQQAPQVASGSCAGLSGNTLRMCEKAASAIPALGGLLGR